MYSLQRQRPQNGDRRAAAPSGPGGVRYAQYVADYRILVVDAFTHTPYAGNPAAVVLDASGLSDADMQAVAREMNLSETAFVTPSETADFRVRFFTPAKEIPLAGHPTIATMHALAEEGRIDLAAGERRVTQQLNVGVLPVDLRTEGGHVTVVMTQARPVFGALLPPGEIAPALGLTTDDLLPGAPCMVVSTGTPQAMVPVRSIAVLRRCVPDMAALAALEQPYGFFSVHVFAIESLHEGHTTHARHFAAGAGIAEDPVTGSATGAMGAYLWRHGLVRQPRFIAEQGHLMGRPGVVTVEVEGSGETPEVVRIAGTAVTVLRGTISV